MKKILYILGGLLVVAGIVWLIVTPGKPGIYDDFAKCIKQAQVTFYGAFWCPHCKAQKARFGKSAQYLPYIECSTADTKGILPICMDVDIHTFPTWDFPTTTLLASGQSTTTIERVTGEQELVDLAKRTGCMLPL